MLLTYWPTVIFFKSSPLDAEVNYTEKFQFLFSPYSHPNGIIFWRHKWIMLMESIILTSNVWSNQNKVNERFVCSHFIQVVILFKYVNQQIGVVQSRPQLRFNFIPVRLVIIPKQNIIEQRQKKKKKQLNAVKNIEVKAY